MLLLIIVFVAFDVNYYLICNILIQYSQHNMLTLRGKYKRRCEVKFLKKYILSAVFLLLITTVVFGIYYGSATKTVFSQGEDNALTRLLGFNNENEAERKYLIPGGQAFGVKFYTEGAIVVDLASFEADSGTVSPAKEAGIKVSDIIIAVNGQKVTSNSDIADIVNSQPGQDVNITFKRNSQLIETTVTPQRCIAQNAYRLGMWVRDSTAGIGTVTYYDPQSNIIAGLGHGISDIDTGILMPMAQGEVISADVTGIVTGQKGNPGQLMGAFNEKTVLGELMSNSEKGIYAKAAAALEGEALPAAHSFEIHEGEAQILCTVDQSGVKSYSAQIENINYLSGDTKNMIIRITDDRLISTTGGIIQGMSGSPIIQDGKLVGAVTHVLVNDPTRGYGIFIENMLNKTN